MMKMMYSLSTGRPPIGESSLRRYCAPSSRFISSVRSCCAETSWPSMSFCTSASLARGLVLAAHASSGRRAAARSSAAPRRAGCCRALSSRFSTSLVPRISTSSCCSFSSCALQVLARLLDDHRLADLGQHEQQDHRAEAAADRVEEREAEHLDVAPAEPRAASWPVPRRAQERAVGPARQRPVGARRHRVAFHRQQDHVDRDAGGQLAERALEQLAAGRRRRWSCAAAAALRPASAARR